MTALLLTAVLLGMRHALDPDHLVAVSTLATEERRSWPAARLGLIWGLGHLLPVSLLGLLLLLLQLTLSERVGGMLELGVGILLVVLGVRTLIRFQKERVHFHLHAHGGDAHAHFHGHSGAEEAAHKNHPTSHHHGGRRGLLTFATGVIHGLAGSGAAAVLAAAAAPSLPIGVAYLLVFGVGTAIGMLAVTFCITTPVLLASSRFSALHGHIRVLAGLASIAVGAMLWVELLPGLLA